MEPILVSMRIFFLDIAFVPASFMTIKWVTIQRKDWSRKTEDNDTDGITVRFSNGCNNKGAYLSWA